MKRLFPLINVVLITAIIFLSVDTAYKIFAAQLNPLDWQMPNISRKSGSRIPPQFQKPPFSKYKAIVERDIFNTKTSTKATAEKVIAENLKPTERNLKLWGTVVGDDPANSIAIIEEPGTRRRRVNQSLYRHGDTVQGARIKKILREKIILSVKGENEILYIATPQSSSKARRVRNVQTRQRQRKRPIRQKRTLRSSQIQQALSNVDTLMSQANIRPHADGFKITRIQPSSIFRRMGLRNGDIITAANNRPINSVSDAMDVWQDLAAGKEPSLEIKRRGRTRIFEYHIR
jgi:general secretion pathway protein C